MFVLDDNMDDEDDDEDLVVIVMLLQCMSFQVNALVSDLEGLVGSHICEQRRLCWSLPADKIRVSWDGFLRRVSSLHFRRMFRMSTSCFDCLCRLICDRIGEEVFRSEALLITTKSGYHICGEIKVALSIRMLAGGSYLDLAPLFNISVSTLYKIFGEFLD